MKRTLEELQDALRAAYQDRAFFNGEVRKHKKWLRRNETEVRCENRKIVQLIKMIARAKGKK